MFNFIQKGYFVENLKQMNKVIRNALIVAIVLAIAAFVASRYIKKDTQRLSPQATITFNDSGFVMKMVYCRPYKKGRLIFGPAEKEALQPFGQYWRLGANEATTLEINKGISIEGHQLPAGRYSVYAVPGEEEWEFGINKVADRWGLNEPDYSQDLFTFKLPVIYTEENQEQFTIIIGEVDDEYQIQFWWDTSRITVPFKID